MKRLLLLILSITALPIMASSFSLLKDLTNKSGASGFEKPIRKILRSHWQNSSKSLTTDGMGNLMVEAKNNQKGPKLLVMAHMDETGFMVESITDKGFLRVIPLGGISNATVYAQRWQVNTPKGPKLAYSGMDSVHIMDDMRQAGSPKIESLFLDIGAESSEDAKNNYSIRPGLSVTPISQFAALGSHRYLAKGLDDRIGLAVMDKLLKNSAGSKRENRLIIAATVQEEIGLRGAKTVYASVKPDVAINIEVGIADDYPMLHAKRKGRIILGKGPSVFVYDRSMIPNQALVNWVLELAKKNNIKVQLEVETGYGEDGAALQTSGRGVPAINIGIPIRYAHQHAGVFDERDFNQAVKLTELIASHLNQEVVDGFNNV